MDVRTINAMQGSPTIYKADLDSNCDTCTFEKDEHVMNIKGHIVSVNPFLESLGPQQKV